MHRTLSTLFLTVTLGFLLAGCRDSGSSSDPNPKIDGSSDVAFEKSVARVRAKLSPDDVDRFDSIIASKYYTTGKGRKEFNGLTAAELFAKTDKEAGAERERMSKYQRLQEQLEDLPDLKLPPEEEKAKRHAILREIKALGIEIPDSAFEK